MSLNGLVSFGYLYAHDQEQSHHPIHHLFSSASLSCDLFYVDKTYYASYSPFATTPGSRSPRVDDTFNSKISEISSLAIHNVHSTILNNKTARMLANMSRLDLKNTGLCSLPLQMTQLTRLTVLDLSCNRLTTISPEILQLQHLEYLNVSGNRITELPPNMALRKLTHINVSDNPIEYIPSSLIRSKSLKHLDFSRTLIQDVPAELLSLANATIKVDNCTRLEQRLQSFDHPLAYNPPSLMEICAIQVIHTLLPPKPKKRSKLWEKTVQPPPFSLPLPDHILSFIAHPQQCTFCGAPYYNTPIIRYRIIRHQEDTWIPVRYSLCSAHWSNDTDRLVALFAHHTSPMLHRDWERELAAVLG